MNWLRHGPAAYVATFVAITAFWAVLLGPAMVLMYSNVGYSGIAYPALAFVLFALGGVFIVAVSRRVSPSGWLATPLLIAALAIVLALVILGQPQFMGPLSLAT